MDDNYGMLKVVVQPAVQAALREWIASKGLILFRIPGEGDLPTYGMGLTGGQSYEPHAADAMTAAQYEEWSASPED